MRWMRKMLWSSILSLIGFAALWGMSDFIRPGMKSINELPKYIALVQKRRLDPLASSEDLKKVMEETPEGFDGLNETLKHSPSNPASLPSELEAEARSTDSPTTPSHQETGLVLVNGKNFVDPSALEKIERMNIPQSMKDEILATYKRSGILPSFQETETRQGTRAPANILPPGRSQSN